MLTISKALSSSQAQSYHKLEFTSDAQNYYKQGDTVKGEVQGVGFRQYVRNAGERLQLAGWVRNTADGGVEVVAQGAPMAEEALLVAVRRGPRGARRTG